MNQLIEGLTMVNMYDRVLYGTDYPILPNAPYRTFVEAVIPKEHHEKVFRTNAEELFGLKLDEVPASQDK